MHHRQVGQEAGHLLGLIEMGVRPGGEHDEVEQRLKSAAARCRELGPSFRLALTLGPSFRLALTLLEHSEWLIVQVRAEEGEQVLTAVRETLERLEAKPWPEHAAQSQPLGADRGYDLITASEAACRSSAKKRQAQSRGG